MVQAKHEMIIKSQRRVQICVLQEEKGHMTPASCQLPQSDFNYKDGDDTVFKGRAGNNETVGKNNRLCCDKNGRQ